MLFTEENLQRIGEGFRKCEQYFDSMNDNFNPDSIPDSAYGVNIDIGRYNDAVCSGYPLNDGQPGNGKSIGQRKRFMSAYERAEATFGTSNPLDPCVFVDEGADNAGNNKCIGTIPFRQFIYDDSEILNDGQQLSQCVLRSRFDKSLYYDKDTYEAVAGNPFFEFFQIVSTQNPLSTGGTDNRKYFNTDSVDLQFNNGYTDLFDGIKRTTEDLINLAEKYNVACIPVFPPTNDHTGGDWTIGGGRPFIGFFSKFALSKSNPINNTSLSDGENFSIDARNCPYGIPLGYDPSAIRNPQMLFYNTNYADPSKLNATEKAFNPCCFLGAVNPSINFDPSLSRFNISGLNTPMTIGNGLPTQNQFDLEPTGNPEQQCININVPGQIADVNTFSGFNNSGGNTNVPVITIRLNEFVPQTSDKIIDSYSGLSIDSIILLFDDGTETALQGNGLYDKQYNTFKKLSTASDIKYPGDVLDGTLFGKMGFKINQLLPAFGSPYADYEDPLVFLKDSTNTFQDQAASTFLDVFRNTQKPMSTGAIVNSAEYQPSSTNQQDMPLYGLGSNMGLLSRPAVEQGGITAQDLPTKLDFPYLLIYSSIISGGTDTQYYGGLDGKSKLPCVGYITRNYNQSDFFYSLEQSFTYTATKTYTLTEVKTEIRLPDGSRPRLQPHNSVIYKITKPMSLPLELPPAVPEPVDTNRQKRENSTKQKK